MIFIELSGYIYSKKLFKDSNKVGSEIHKCCIENCIKNEFIINSEVSNFNIYLEKLEKQWQDKILDNLKSLYGEIELVGFKDIDGIECYIFKEKMIQEKTKVSLKLLLLVEKDDVDSAINIVYKQLNKFFSNKRFYFSTNKKVKIYLTGENDNDIVDYQVYNRQYVEVDLKKEKLIDTYMIIKEGVLLIFMIICISIAISNNDNEVLKNIMYGITASIIFSIIIEIISKIMEWINNKYKIVIRNISTFAQEQTKTKRRPFAEKEEIDELHDPELNYSE